MPAIRKRRLGLSVFGAMALLIALSSPAGAPPGDLDPSFDGDGRVTTHFDIYDQVEAVAIQSDQKIVAVGFAHLPLIPETERFALARYNPDGSLDPSFDGDGKVTTKFSSNDYAHGVVIQADGKIVVAGTAFVPPTYDFALARYNPDGSLDTTFDGDGIVTTDFGDLRRRREGDVAYTVAIQTDGRIVAAGRAYGPLSVSEEFALARYNPDGSLDTTFDGDGRVTTDFAADVDQAHSVGIRGDGKIVAAGRASLVGAFDFALARYNPDGSLDTTFDLDGKVTTDFSGSGDGAEGMVIQGDGKIVAVGLFAASGVEDFALARYNPDGSLDTTFHGDGKVTTDFAGGRDRAFGVVNQRNEKIVVAGCSFCSLPPRPPPGPSDFALARYNPDGSLDTTFQGDGKATTDFAGGDDEALAVAIQGDGKIVAAGCRDCTYGANADFAVARYRADFEADLSITKAGPSGRVPTGRNMTYTLTVTNNGPDSAFGVTVTDQLPSAVTFASTRATQGSCGESNGTVFCSLGEVSSGTVVSIEIVVRPNMAGLITNMASVASPTPDPDQGNNADSVDTSICRITSRRSSIPCG